MKPRALVSGLLLLVLASASIADDRTLTLVADQWCPFNCSDDPDDRGVLVERAAKALASQGFDIEYQEMPWTRAIIGVREGLYDGIVGAGLAETPDFHFPAKPIAVARHSFFTLPTNPWTYQGFESLHNVRLGVIQDYSYGGLFDAYIKPNRGDDDRLVILRGDNVLPRLVKMLELGRIDALVAEEQVLNYHFNRKGKINPLRNAGLAGEEALYVAFSPALDDGAALAATLGRALAAMDDQAH